MNFWEKLPKSKQPSKKSYNTLKTAVLDELVIAKLGFLVIWQVCSSHFQQHIKQIVQ